MGIMQSLRYKVLSIGICISLLAFVVSYFLIEKEVHEYRITYSVSEADYGNYLNLQDYYAERSLFSVSISPNFESIADSLKNLGLRRFELKEFHTGKFSLNSIDTMYFLEFSKKDSRNTIGKRYVGHSRPLKTSTGISLAILCFALILDRIGVFRTR